MTSSKGRPYLRTAQDPPTLPDNRFERLEATASREDEAQIPHILVPLIPSPFARDDTWEPHHTILRPSPFLPLVCYTTGREEGDESPMEILLRDDVFRDEGKVQ